MQRLRAGWLRRHVPAAWLFALTCALGAHAQAPEPEPAQPPPAGARKPDEPKQDDKKEEKRTEPAQPPISADEKRPVPNYDGREAEPTDAGDVLIWVPRIVLSPLYLVSEYALRRPLGWLVTTAEHERLPALLVDFFTFGPERNSGIVPTVLIDFGFKPSVGLYFFWNEFLADNNKLRARAATWGKDWLMFSVADRLEIYPGHELSLRGEFLRRPDWVYHGLGPDTLDDDLARYGSTTLSAGLNYDAAFWRSSRVQAFVGLRDVDFESDTSCCGDPSVARRMELGQLAEPVGIEDGYTIFEQGLAVTLDSRPPRFMEPTEDAPNFVTPPGSGVRLNVRGAHAGSTSLSSPLGGAPPIRYEWVRYGASLGGFLDLTGYQRVVGLSVVADFADPLNDVEPLEGVAAIPFTEQVSLGGNRPLRGFLQQRLVDRSAVAATLEYQWPIWVFLDGAMHYSVGNVFGEHLDGFKAKKLRNSIGLGVRSTTARDHPFEILVAVGTETFEQGAQIDNIRFVFGTTSGF
jgi:hypothetical protein